MSSAGDQLIQQYGAIHASRMYGNTSVKNLRFIRPYIRFLDPASVLDYGCGRSRLLEALDFAPGVRTFRYDPAIPEYATLPPIKVDLVINVDVLEHVPEADLGGVVGSMRDLGRHALIIVDTKPASLILPNGANAHCTLHPASWWQDYLGRFFSDLVPIRAARRSRAAFCTWRLSPLQRAAFPLLRVAEDVAFRTGRIVRGKDDWSKPA